MAKKKEKKQPFQDISADTLAKKVAEDITTFSRDAAKVKRPKDLSSMRLSPVLSSSAANIFSGVIGQIQKEAEKVRQEQESQVEAQSQALEKSIKSRQDSLKRNLDEFKKKVAEDDDSAKAVEMIIDRNITSYERHIEGIRIEKSTLSGIRKVSP
jgi:hypothetical protein